VLKRYREIYSRDKRKEGAKHGPNGTEIRYLLNARRMLEKVLFFMYLVNTKHSILKVDKDIYIVTQSK